MPTHAVTNQVPPLVGYDVAAADPALYAGLAAAGATLNTDLQASAIDAGSAEVIEAVRLADTNTPGLHTHDRGGNALRAMVAAVTPVPVG